MEEVGGDVDWLPESRYVCSDVELAGSRHGRMQPAHNAGAESKQKPPAPLVLVELLDI